MEQSLDIRQFVDRAPIVVDENAPLRAALHLMGEHEIGAVLVLRDSRLAGILTERDLVRILPSDTDGLLDRPLYELMTPDPVTVDVEDRFNDVYTKMKSLHVRHLPILDGDELVGIVSMRDLVHTYQNFLIAQYEDARGRLDRMETLVGLGGDDRIASLVNELERYKRLSMTDSLTGLYNKRYFTSRLTQEIARSHRYDSPLSLIFADIDHFKAVNDEHGHDTGDEVLRQIGAILNAGVEYGGIVSRLRKSDIVARFGGEEFVIILPETTVEGAVAVGEKLRRTIEEQVFFGGVRITVSFGCAEGGRDSGGADDLIKAADVALYRAKDDGRNRVEAADLRS